MDGDEGDFDGEDGVCNALCMHTRAGVRVRVIAGREEAGSAT